MCVCVWGLPLSCAKAYAPLNNPSQYRFELFFAIWPWAFDWALRCVACASFDSHLVAVSASKMRWILR